MKKLAMVLSLVAMVALTSNVFAQEKGQIQFALGGTLMTSEKARVSGANSAMVIYPVATGRYFVADKIGIDGGLAIQKGNKYSVFGKELGIDLMLGGRYYYWGQDKMKLNAGLDLMFGMGKARETLDDKGKKVSMPMDIRVALTEFEYWPMEGGAISAEAFFDYNGLNLGKAGTNAFGIDLGIKIRIK